MSSVVAETSAQLSNPVAKPKGGTNGQSSADNGFSGLVDSNLAAAAESETRPAQAKPRKSDRAADADPHAPRIGVHKKTKAAEPARNSAPDQKAAQPEEAKAETTAEAAPAAEGAVKTGIVSATVSAELSEAIVEAKADVASPAPAQLATGVVVAVAIPTELAVEVAAEQVIDSGDAVAVTNPPATLAAPAGIAANALAKVAADTADADLDADAAAQTQAAATDAAPDVPATESAAESETLIETAAAEVQLEAKAKTELATAAKPAEQPKPVAPPENAKLEAAVKIEPAKSKETPAAEQPSAAKPVAHDDHRVEAKPAPQPASDKPAETEARPAQRPAPEQPAQASPPAHAEKPQPNGVGLAQAALHVPTVALQSAAFTAVAAAGAPVPLNGLAVEIAANVQIGRSRFEIRLDPPELGRIDVRLDVDKQGHVTSHLIVEKSATLDLLRRDAQQLERALQDAGLKTSDNGLQFSLRDQSQSGRQDDGSSRNGHRLIVAEEDTVAAETAGRSYGRMAGRRGGIDIRV